MTRILALDLAKNSGWAVIADGLPVAGSWPLLEGIKVNGKNAVPLDVQHVIQIQRLRAHITSLIAEHGIEVVAIEREFGRGSGSRLLVSLFAAAQEAAYSAGLPAISITVGQWRKAIHGTAGKDTEFYKSEALRICGILDVPVPDTDAAEAVLIAKYVRKHVRVHPASIGRAA